VAITNIQYRTIFFYFTDCNNKTEYAAWKCNYYYYYNYYLLLFCFCHLCHDS